MDSPEYHRLAEIEVDDVSPSHQGFALISRRAPSGLTAALRPRRSRAPQR